MALGTLSPRLPVEAPVRTGGGGKPPVDHSSGGGGGGGRGGDGGAPDYQERLRRYRLGMAIGLVSIVMLFISFSTAYILRETSGVYDPVSGDIVRNWAQLKLPMGLLWLNTLLLLSSSITVELARRQTARQALIAPILAIPGIRNDERHFPWLHITIVLGFAFITGQVLAWKELVQRGFLMGSGASSSFFYLLTGTHALHLLGGVAALLYAIVITWMRKPIEQRHIVIDVTAWYWHVIDLLWIYLFALLAFAH